jgi:uncharacterized membrane protein YoaK (UPF0700 family)
MDESTGRHEADTRARAGAAVAETTEADIAAGGLLAAPTETRQAERIRDTLAVALTVLTGATDAIAFTKLGGVFTSVMTGNMVLLGIGVGRGDLSTLEHTALAVVAYILGTVLGARVAGSPREADRVWERALTWALLVELALFVAVAIAWWSSGSSPTGAMQSSLLAVSALGLGLQSGAVLRLNVSGLSTTYLTGTLTTVVHTVTTTRRIKGAERSLCVLVALMVGAGVGAALATQVPVAAPIVSLVILTGVLITAWSAFHRTDRHPHSKG